MMCSHPMTQIRWANSKRRMQCRQIWPYSIALCLGGVFSGGLMDLQPRICPKVGCSCVGRRLGHVHQAVLQMFSLLGVGQMVRMWFRFLIGVLQKEHTVWCS